MRIVDGLIKQEFERPLTLEIVVSDGGGWSYHVNGRAAKYDNWLILRELQQISARLKKLEEISGSRSTDGN